jgi:hypothetical protein
MKKNLVEILGPMVPPLGGFTWNVSSSREYCSDLGSFRFRGLYTTYVELVWLKNFNGY